MEITEIKVFPVEEERLKAYVTIILDNCFVVRDLKVIHGNTGLFVAMPSKKRKDGTFKDIAHPLNTETRNDMERKILDAFDKEWELQGKPVIPRDTPPEGVSAQGERDDYEGSEDNRYNRAE